MKKNLTYYQNLDGLRGIAAIMVVICHFFLMNSVEHYIGSKAYGQFSKFGQHGVSLFFVLSGFVITRILINNKSEDNYFRQFYWRRFLRIFPLYYLFLFLWYWILPLIVHNDILPLHKQIPFYFYFQNFDWLTHVSQEAPGQPYHYWSLAVEEHFYLIWPLVIYITPAKHVSKVIIGMILLVIPIKILFLNHGISINKTTFTRFDQILLGALLAYLESNNQLFERSQFFKKLFKILLLVCLPLAVYVFANKGRFHELKEVVKYNLLGLIFFAIIGLVILSKAKAGFNKFLESKVMQYLGTISYGIYVWHAAALLLVDKLMLTKIWPLDFLFTLILTLIMAHCSYFYYEKKILKYK